MRKAGAESFRLFLLGYKRTSPTAFVRGVDAEHARLKSLLANDAFQMDAQEYRQFTNAGGWSIAWDCGFTP